MKEQNTKSDTPFLAGYLLQSLIYRPTRIWIGIYSGNVDDLGWEEA
ncbi:Uncharacterised protein [Serratia liquefaciens]|nr:hypothetical protein 376p_00048 [Serratia liquefaciens]ULG13440.1 hypothetical protein 1p_00059 [Serratia proteamaculans]CAI1215416.1 Uncharacterised protein [Serratia quinivorans]ULG12961.1 hypothetical protein 377p_00044 [Serratia liquefaciens]ULG18784.1 hypothetical protein R10p_00060 [Serratia proteamaculans]